MHLMIQAAVYGECVYDSDNTKSPILDSNRFWSVFIGFLDKRKEQDVRLMFKEAIIQNHTEKSSRIHCFSFRITNIEVQCCKINMRWVHS